MPDSWSRLHVTTVLEYLSSVGLLCGPGGWEVSRARGRATTFLIRRSTGPLWFVKQFGEGDWEFEAFHRELSFVRCGRWPVCSPAWSDEPYRLIVYRAASPSMWERLAETDDLSESVVTGLLDALRAIPALPSEGERLPPIIVRLLHPGDDLSLGQRRILTALIGADRPVALAREAHDAWSAQVTTVHGDMKLEHALVNDRGQVTFVDWEAAGHGPHDWDRAGLIQSLMAQPLLDVAAWSSLHDKLAGALIADSESSSDHLAQFVGLRLWQTALEWTRGRARPSKQTARLCQLGLAISADPGQLTQLLRAASR